MKRIGITGSIGSGKSTVSNVLKHLGYPVYDSDSHAKHLMRSQADLISAIQKLLGKDSYTENGDLNTAYIAQQIFSNPELTKAMNALVHPYVFKDFDEFCTQQISPIVFKEAALTFESGSYQMLDKVICVCAPDAIRIQRVETRDHLTESQIRQRMNNQWTQELKASASDFIINNDGKEAIIPQIINILTQLQYGK